MFIAGCCLLYLIPICHELSHHGALMSSMSSEWTNHWYFVVMYPNGLTSSLFGWQSLWPSTEFFRFSVGCTLAWIVDVMMLNSIGRQDGFIVAAPYRVVLHSSIGLVGVQIFVFRCRGTLYLFPLQWSSCVIFYWYTSYGSSSWACVGGCSLGSCLCFSPSFLKTLFTLYL